MTHRPTPLPPELRALLDVERDRPDLASREIDDAWARFSTNLAAGSGGDDGGSEPTGSSGSSPAGAGQVGAAGTGQVGSAPAGGPGGWARAITTLGLGVVLGAVAATTLSASPSRLGPSAVSPKVIVLTAPPSSDAPTAASAATPPPLPSSAPGTSTPPSSGPAVASGSVGEALSAERALIDRARAALARGNTPAARQALAAHRTRFPTGQLNEERAALEIRVLRAEGAEGEAEAAQRRFEERYPGSILTPAD